MACVVSNDVINTKLSRARPGCLWPRPQSSRTRDQGWDWDWHWGQQRQPFI